MEWWQIPATITALVCAVLLLVVVMANLFDDSDTRPDRPDWEQM